MTTLELMVNLISCLAAITTLCVQHFDARRSRAHRRSAEVTAKPEENNR
jgi:hypothetical protein